MTAKIPPKPTAINNKISEFAFNKVPLSQESWCTNGSRANFYKCCRKYNARFKATPPPELFEYLWTESLKLRS